MTNRSEHQGRRGNRLIREKSPYLLQHADNPVDWFPWGPEAFQKAQRESKPVFLSIALGPSQEILAAGDPGDPEGERLAAVRISRYEKPGKRRRAFLCPGRQDDVNLDGPAALSFIIVSPKFVRFQV